MNSKDISNKPKKKINKWPLIIGSILGIIFFIIWVVSSISPPPRLSKDARRTRDLNQIRTAMEMYYTDTGIYPVSDEKPVDVGAYLAFPENVPPNNYIWMNNVGYDQYYCVSVLLENPSDLTKPFYIVHQDGMYFSADPCVFLEKEPQDISDSLQKDLAYKIKAIKEQDILFCKEIQTTHIRRGCILEMAIAKKDPSLCLSSESEFHNYCFYEVAIAEQDPSICLLISVDEGGKIRMKGEWPAKEDCFREIKIGETFCENIEGDFVKDICYLTLSECEKINHKGLKERCFEENIIEIWKKSGFEEAIKSCENITNDFNQGLCFQTLAQEIAKYNVEKALLLVDKVSDIDRKGIMLRLIAVEVAEENSEKAFEICDRITQKTLHSSREDCISAVQSKIKE